jgi:hypothetical protein
MSSINFSKALCLVFTAAIAVASFSSVASARWGDQNERHDERRDDHQGWNRDYYRAPPVVYQNYNAPTYYAPPVVYGSGLGLNINIR